MDGTNITAENIRKDVSILGITGTLEEGITPSGNVNITDTNVVDVTNYATAQVIDSGLIASNIRKNTNILGITGTLEGIDDIKTTDNIIEIISYNSDDSINEVLVDGPIAATLFALYDRDYEDFVSIFVPMKPSTISLGPELATIGDYMFAYCTDSLTLTELPDGVTSIGNYAFSNCTSLALTSLPDGVTSIGNYAFYGCTSLALTSLPDGVTSIGNYAFYNCTSLALTSLRDGVTSIGASAFRNCTSLALTSLPDGVTSIGANAFYNCTSLTSITFKGTPTTILASAFLSCTNLTDIYVPWVEGVVANAPWGATNATIHYGVTG